MPGATSLGIPYPYVFETVDADSWLDMANAIDALLTTLDGIRDVALNHLSARISGGTTAAVASATTTTVTNFTTVTWDTGGYANLVGFPSQLTVGPGLYYAEAMLAPNGSVTTQAMTRLQIVTGATVWGANTVDTTGSTSVTLSATSALILCTAPTTAIQAQVRWQGTGGPPAFDSGTLQVMKVRALADM